MKQKYILKIGLVIIVTFAVLGTSYTPSADVCPVMLPEYRALLISPFHNELGGWYKASFENLERTLIAEGWDEDNIVKLYNPSVNEQDIIDAIEEFAIVDEAPDTFLIVIGTHGYEGGFCLNSDPGMDYSDLDLELDKLDSQSVGIIITACYSWTAHDPSSHLREDGRVLITSTRLSFINDIAEAFYDLADYNYEIGDGNGAVSMEEAYDLLVYNGEGPNCIFWSGFPVIGETEPLHITLQDWEDGRVDQLPSKTIDTQTVRKVYKYDTEDRRVAQSFRPAMGFLSKVRIRMKLKNEPTSDFKVSLKGYPEQGTDYASDVLEASDFPNSSKTLECYIDFDLDYSTTPNARYYIVCESLEPEEDEDNEYYVRTYSNCYIPLFDFCCWVYEDSPPWVRESDLDVQFVTYGKTPFMPPHTPLRPYGPVRGVEDVTYQYHVRGTHYAGLYVYLEVDWDDGTTSGWLGPYPSGYKPCIQHSWSEPGEYNIKVRAKDVFTVTGEWSDVLHVVIE